jgi:drug/metabolite transporter (DMT)-like permease
VAHQPGVNAPQPGSPAQILRGRLAGLVAATGFGALTTLARIAYDDGANPASMIMARYLLALLVMVAVVAYRRSSIAIGRGDVLPLIVTATALFGMTACYLFSVLFIPVSLAALLFYTFPLIVAVASPLLGGGALSRLKGLAFLAAFAGLALALGPRLDNLDPRGVALALGAAVSTAIYLIACRRLVARRGADFVAFHIQWTGALLAALLLLWPQGLALPQTNTAVVAFAAACLLYPAATLAVFLAVRLTGPADTAMALNLEPVVSILAAILLLGERLSPVQWAGVALVATAIFLAAREKAAARPAKPPG